MSGQIRQRSNISSGNGNRQQSISQILAGSAVGGRRCNVASVTAAAAVAMSAATATASNSSSGSGNSQQSNSQTLAGSAIGGRMCKVASVTTMATASMSTPTTTARNLPVAVWQPQARNVCLFTFWFVNNQPAPNTPGIEANAISQPPQQRRQRHCAPPGKIAIGVGRVVCGQLLQQCALVDAPTAFFTASIFTVLIFVCLKRLLVVA